MAETTSRVQPPNTGTGESTPDFATAASKRLIKRPEYYLTAATNEMYRLLLKIDTQTTLAAGDKANLLAAANVGCQALGWLVNDADFKTEVDQLTRRLASEKEPIVSILGDPEQFEQFLAVERDVMTRLGMDVAVTDQLLDRCLLELRTLSHNGIASGRLLETISSLRIEICRHAATLRLARQQQLPSGWTKQNLRFRLLEATFGVGGTA